MFSYLNLFARSKVAIVCWSCLSTLPMLKFNFMSSTTKWMIKIMAIALSHGNYELLSKQTNFGFLPNGRRSQRAF